MTGPGSGAPLGGSAPLLFMGLLGWDSHNQEEAQLVRHLARRGHPVVYLAPLGLRDPGPRQLAAALRRWRRHRGAAQGAAGVRTARLLVLPGRERRPVAWLNRCLVRRRLREALRAAAIQHPILWLRLPTPELVDQIEALRPRAVVYERIDDYAAYPQYGAADRDRLRRYERRLVARADLVITLTATAAERLPLPGRRSHVVPLGVDLGHFGRGPGREPPDLARLPRPRLGLVGGLDQRVDLDLVDRLATAEPTWSIVLIGPVARDTDPRRLGALPNVHLLGARPYALVPDYLAALDVCLVPYRRSRWTEACFPAKLFEYLASGRAVVATNLPALAPYAAEVELAHDAADFLAACRRAVRDGACHTGSARAARRRAVAAAHSLDARCDTLDALLASLAA